MLWPHTKIPTYRDCFQQATSNKTTDNNFRPHYILHSIFAQDNLLRFDTTSFLQNQIQKPITMLRPYYFYTRFDALLQEKFISN